MVLHEPVVEGQSLDDGRVVLGALLELLKAEIPIVVLHTTKKWMRVDEKKQQLHGILAMRKR